MKHNAAWNTLPIERSTILPHEFLLTSSQHLKNDETLTWHLQNLRQGVEREKKRRLLKKTHPSGKSSKEAGALLLPSTSVLGDHVALGAECFMVTTPHLAMGFGPQRWQRPQGELAAVFLKAARL